MEEYHDPLIGNPDHKTNGIRYEGFIFQKHARDALLRMENFEVREDDTWVVSFPRSGTLWVQEIVYLIANGANIEKAKSEKIINRFPHLEHFYPGICAIEKLESPRFIKSHFPYHLLPRQINRDKKAKIIYVARNPRDTCVSLHHFMKVSKYYEYRGTFHDSFDRFLNDEAVYSPWWKHVLDFWEHRCDDNILFLKYENLQKDISSVVKQIAVFLGKSLTGEQIDTIAKYCSFQSMSRNDSANYTYFDGAATKPKASFIRIGKVGDWQNYFTPKMISDLDEKVGLKLKNSGLVFDYTLNDCGLPNDSNVVRGIMKAKAKY